MESFVDALARELGQAVGNLTGRIIAVLLYLLIALIFYGLPCDRIISKAGFEGGTHLGLFIAVFQPMILVPLSAYLFGETSSTTEAIWALSGLILIVAFYIIAFSPWPIWGEIRQLRRKLGLNPESGEPIDPSKK